MNQRFESCSDVRSALPLWAGGDLEPGENQAVKKHLDLCESCRGSAELADLSRRELVLQLEGSIGKTPDLWSGVRAQLVAEGEAPQAPVLAGPGSWIRRTGIGVAAAAAALLVTFPLADRLFSKHGASVPGRAGVGEIAVAPSMPGASRPVVAPMGPVAADPGQTEDQSRRLRPLGPDSSELWRNAEAVSLESLESLRLMSNEVRFGQDSQMRLTGDR